jgi:hypothetical protein
MSAPSAQRPITDSPWFWAYLFGTAALIALALAGPKFGPRQAEIERQFQGRQRATQNAAGQQPSVDLSTAEGTRITLRPLFFVLAAVTMVAWLVFWRTHTHRRRAALARTDPSASASSPAPPGTP